MAIDIPTVAAAVVMVQAMLAASLLFAWTLNRDIRALAWWGLSFVLVLAAAGSLRVGRGEPTSQILVLSNILLTSAYGLFYSGCRAFNQRPVRALHAGAGAILWCLCFPAVLQDVNERIAVTSAIGALYSLLGAWELWRHARSPLASQRAAVVFLLGLAVFNMVRGVTGFSLAHAFWIAHSGARWSPMMAVAIAILMPTLAFICLSMAMEQRESTFRRAALIDPLTGIFNRRAFFQEASTLLSATSPAPVSCLLFDLDNFKGVNDCHGHDTGDAVLQIFARILSERLESSAYGRLGGEEFGALLPLSRAQAEALAEDIRHSFASAACVVNGRSVGATVSAGCVTGRHASVERFLRDADEALYRAKASGRNAVIATGTAGGFKPSVLRT